MVGGIPIVMTLLFGLAINQDVRLYASLLAPGKAVEHQVPAGRHAWVQVVKGRITVRGVELGPGDGAATSVAGAMPITAQEAAEFLVFDLS